MKILMTSDTVGGVWTYSLELARGLTADHVEILLATMGKPLTADQRRDVAQIKHVTVAESEYLLEWMAEPWDDVSAAGAWLLDLADQFHPDVIHLNNFAHGTLPWRAPVLMVAHSCVLSWHRAVRRTAAGAEWCRYRDEVRSGLAAADLVVAPTRAMLKTLEVNYGALPRCRVIFNGRDGNGFPYQPRCRQPQVIAVGRLWDEAKNVSAVAQAAARLPCPVRVAGPRQFDRSEVSLTGVEWLGPLPASRMPALYAEAAILAHPARYEPFGLVPLEAALSGCALVLGDIDTLREIWGDAAMYVAPDDLDQLTASISCLIQDADFRMRQAERAHRRALRLTRERMTRRYLHAYREVRSAVPVPGQLECGTFLPAAGSTEP